MNQQVEGNSEVADLAELRRESRARQVELAQIAAALPVAQSRRQVLREMIVDAARAPNRPAVARRVMAKILRLPVDLVRRMTAR